MIVAGPGTPTRLLGDGNVPESMWRCLARRGMVYSECETFEHVALAPGVLSGYDDPGTEHAIYVVTGSGALQLGEGSPQLRQHDVVLLSDSSCAVVEAGPAGIEFLALDVLSARSIASLPPRLPELPPHERAICVSTGMAEEKEAT